MRPASVRSTVNRRIGTERPWALPVGRVAADLATDPVVGLPAGEAASRLARFGENVLVELGRAEQAMAALKAMAVPVVRVRRGGPAQDLPTAEVVPADLLPADLHPADLRLTSRGLEEWIMRRRSRRSRRLPA